MSLALTAESRSDAGDAPVRAAACPLALDGLSKRYRGRAAPVVALDNLSLSLHRGELMSLVGPNGAGKSTTLRIIAGLVRPDSGTVSFFGRSHADRGVRSQALGGMLDGGRILYPRLTVGENLEYLGILKGLGRAQARKRSQDLLQRFELASRAHDVFQKLSRGMQQRVALIGSLVHKPRVLILDEPTLGLDQDAQKTVIDLLEEFRKDGMTVLLTSHQLDLVERVSSRIAFIKGGAIHGVLSRSDLDTFAQRPPRLAVRFETEAIAGHLHAPAQFPIQVVDGAKHTDLIVDVADIYRLLERVRPCPVVSIERTRTALMSAYDAVFATEARHV